MRLVCGSLLEKVLVNGRFLYHQMKDTAPLLRHALIASNMFIWSFHEHPMVTIQIGSSAFFLRSLYQLGAHVVKSSEHAITEQGIRLEAAKKSPSMKISWI